MAVNTAPIFIDAGYIGAVTISTANTNLDGTGTIADLVDAGTTDGIRVDRIEAVATGTTTAGVLRFFIHDNTVWRFWREAPVTAAVPSVSIRAARIAPIILNTGTVMDGAFVLPTDYKIGVATYNAEEFEVFAFGGLL